MINEACLSQSGNLTGKRSKCSDSTEPLNNENTIGALLRVSLRCVFGHSVRLNVTKKEVFWSYIKGFRLDDKLFSGKRHELKH